MIFAIVHYNTPELLTCCIASVFKNYPDAKIVIFENSDKRKFDNIFGDNVKIFDNSLGQIIDFNKEIENLIKTNSLPASIKTKELEVSNFGTFKHSLSIQYILDNIKENFVLLDSDILFKKKLNLEIKDEVCIADITNCRVLPFVVLFNHNVIKENHILFCDKKHILPVKPIPEFDTGGLFLSMINDKKLKIKRIKFEDYIVHYGNGSWKENGNKHSALKTYKINYKEWLSKFKELWSL